MNEKKNDEQTNRGFFDHINKAKKNAKIFKKLLGAFAMI